MTAIKSFEQLNSMVSEFRKTHGRLLSNCYMMPDEIERHCADGIVKAEVIGDWLIILFDYADYAGLCYYTTAESEIPDFSPIFENSGEKSVLFDSIVRKGAGDKITSKKLIEAGVAEPYKAYVRVMLPLDKVNFQNFPLAEGYRVDPDYDNYEEFYALISGELDAKSMPFPDKAKFDRIQKEGGVISIVDEKGDLASTTLLTCSGSIGLPLHFATSKQHRRKGLGTYVFEEMIRKAQSRGMRLLRGWIEQTNVASFALCHRLGYVEDGTVCEQYIMKGI